MLMINDRLLIIKNNYHLKFYDIIIIIRITIIIFIINNSDNQFMVHLLVHVVREIKFCGPVYLRWMYPIERYKIFCYIVGFVG